MLMTRFGNEITQSMIDLKATFFQSFRKQVCAECHVARAATGSRGHHGRQAKHAQLCTGLERQCGIIVFQHHNRFPDQAIIEILLCGTNCLRSVIIADKISCLGRNLHTAHAAKELSHHTIPICHQQIGSEYDCGEQCQYRDMRHKICALPRGMLFFCIGKPLLNSVQSSVPFEGECSMDQILWGDFVLIMHLFALIGLGMAANPLSVQFGIAAYSDDTEYSKVTGRAFFLLSPICVVKK